MMKQKPKQKLALRHETIRQLETLELRRAVGGDGAPLAFDTGKIACGTSTAVAPAGGG